MDQNRLDFLKSNVCCKGRVILWGPGTTARRDTAPDGIYLFVVWAVLIVLAALLAPGLANSADDGAGPLPEDAGADGTQDDA